MSELREIPGTDTLDAIAGAGGLSVVVVDPSGVQISASNDNSICRTLNPEGKLVGQCAAYCGAALAEAQELNGHAAYVCHAGLACRAAALAHDGKPVAVIAGRTFVSAESYRKATERAISGDWQEYSPVDMFENVLLAVSADDAEAALAEVEALTTAVPVPETEDVAPAETDVVTQEVDEAAADEDEIELLELDDVAEPVKEEPARTAEGVDALALRSFFTSVLRKDHRAACDAFLELIATSYGFDELVWFERTDGRMQSLTALGPLKGKKIVLGMPADDPRLSEAVGKEAPVILTEQSHGSDGERTMYVFPAPVGQEISATLAIVGRTDDDKALHQIARLCSAAGPQLELLRLRREVSRKNLLSESVRRFSEGLRAMDSDDTWHAIIRAAADLMQAERGSLLVLNDESGTFEIKSAVGIRADLASETDAGRRVAHSVLKRGRPAAVKDISRTGLPPAPERGYKSGSFLSSPIALAGRNIAVINFADKAGGEFGHDDLELIEEIGPQIEAAIDRAILKEKAGQFQQLSVTDALTGLLNRRYMDERLLEEVKRSNRHGYPMSFVMLDVDHFKSYNDEFGHPAGDEALKLVGRILRDTLRGADVAARYGGEEFAVLLPQTNSEEAAVIAERLRANIESTEFPHRAVTISVGVATCSSELCTANGLMLAADNALYDAKRSGRNRVHGHRELEMAATDLIQ